MRRGKKRKRKSGMNAISERKWKERVVKKRRGGEGRGEGRGERPAAGVGTPGNIERY